MKRLNNKISQVSRFFHILSHPVRLQILLLIERDKKCVNDLVSELKMEQSSVSHQLAYLKLNHFVKTNKVGKTVYYQLYCHHINELIDIAQDHINNHCN